MRSFPQATPAAISGRGKEPSELAALLAGLVRVEGFAPTHLPGVGLLHSRQTHPPTPVAYDPSVVILAQGRKHGKLGEHAFTYDARRYLVLAVPLPFECETIGTPAEPLLGLVVRVNPATVAELLLELDAAGSAGAAIPPTPPSIGVATLTPEMGDAAVRLARCLRSPAESRILGPQIVREITYWALGGDQGAALRALVSPRSSLHRIAGALRRIHADHAGTPGVSTLAREAGMSVSTFHAQFKAVTAQPPRRYLQTVRLHRARVLLASGTVVAEAARQVGYESPSQFSREFKRLFGGTPRSVGGRPHTGSFTFLEPGGSGQVRKPGPGEATVRERV